MRVDVVTDMRLGAVKTLPTRWTDERVIVKRRYHPDAAALRQVGQVERQVQETVDVNDVRLHRLEHLLDPGVDRIGPIRGVERSSLPVVSNLDDRQAIVHAPAQLTVRSGRIVVGRQNRHMVTARQLAAQRRGVDLDAGAVTREEVVYDVQKPMTAHLMPSSRFTRRSSFGSSVSIAVTPISIRLRIVGSSLTV